MLKKRMIAFLLSFSMVFAPVMNVSAASVSGNDLAVDSIVSVSGGNAVQSPSVSVSAGDAEKNSFTENFEGNVGNWEMTGDMADGLSIAEDANGNKYLKMEKEKASPRSAVKEFEVAPAMGKADISFNWYTTALTSDSRSGFAGIRLMDGGREIAAVYMKDMRGAGEKAKVWYSAGGNKTESSFVTENGGCYAVKFSLDFLTYQATITIDGQELAVLDINDDLTKVNQLAFVGEGTGNGRTFSVNMGIDNFAFTYEEADVDLEAIHTLAKLSDVKLTQEEWKAYKHPETVEATLLSGEKISVPIDGTTWTADPAFDEAQRGWYTWTADLAAVPGHDNPRGLRASYRMAYEGQHESQHDFENDFTFDIWEAKAWSNSIGGNSGGFGYAHAEDAEGNYYLEATASGSGDRGSVVDLCSDIIKGATVSLDWMPISQSGTRGGELLFFSQVDWHSYFGLRFDSNWNIVAFTECPIGVKAEEHQIFDGSVNVDKPIETGLNGQNKWFTVELSFDYLDHIADLTIYEKANPDNSFTEENIPIREDANSLSAMILRMVRSGSANLKMGLDNVAIDYEYFTEEDIVQVTNPEDVKIAKVQYDDFKFPEEVQVQLGDGSKATVTVGEWTANPAFDQETEGDYVWSAPLVSDEYKNPLNLKASFTMGYTMLPYPMLANNPKTLELTFGEELPADAFPEKVSVFLSDGTMSDMPVEGWKPIYEFDQTKEGIYVYGAKLKAEEGKTQIVPEALMKNENHEKDDPSKYDYDVFFRISYFETQDNYNGYVRSMENLDRGVYAVQKDEGIFVSWRLLATEYGEDIRFNIYRNGELVNEVPVTNKTNYVDAEGKIGDVYTVTAIMNDKYSESAEVVATAENYISIPLQNPGPQPAADKEMAEYSVNDAGTADVDGDGQYEIIVKWYPGNGFDSGKASSPSSPTIFDVYEMDGTPLWRLNLGLELPSGAHFNQFVLYDMDEDGKAELLIKTSDGSVTYKPNADGRFDMTDESTIVSYVGDKNVVPGSNVSDNGHMNPSTNEYVTVFNGETGEEIDSVDYVNPIKNHDQWGDGWGNRSGRNNIALAYLPKNASDADCTETIPAVLMNRGYYARTTVAAYTLREGKLNLEWNFVAESGTENAGKGNHNMVTGDVDNDGFDELVLGAIAIDHDGTVLWSKNGKDGQDHAGHADAIHLAAMSPESDQLYVFTPQEDTSSTLNSHLSNAANGTRVGGVWLTKGDIGRGVAANITPTPGFEYWAGVPSSEIPDQIPSGAIYNFFGGIESAEKPVNFSTNWVMYWDGDLLNELADAKNPSSPEDTPTVFKYNWEENTMDPLISFEGTKLNNWTKNNPSLTADVLGDWREEMMVPTTDNTELRIYMTTDETDYMIYTLMHDPVYRNAVANQNTSYNQPAHLGFYLGEDIADKVLAKALPTAMVSYTTEGAEWKDIEEEPSEPSEPSEPTDPEEPSEPTDPEEPSEPTDPEEPSEPDNHSSGSDKAPEITADWDSITDQLLETLAQQEGRLDAVTMNFLTGNKAIVPAEVLNDIKGQNVVAAFHTGEKLTFSVCGADMVSEAAMIGEVNLTVEQGDDLIPEKAVSEKLQAAVDSRQFEMEYKGSYGIPVNVHLDMGKENAGRYANMYSYQEESGTMEYIGSFRITENGQAMFALRKGGAYLITVTNEAVTEVAVDVYVVRKGDTLGKIAVKNKISLPRLAALNPQIKDINRIQVGDRITVKE